MPRAKSPSSQSPRPSRSTSRSARRPATVDVAADRPAPVAAVSGQGTGTYNPTYDEIAEAAYHRYLRRGAVDGQDFDDWVEAERELRSRRRES